MGTKISRRNFLKGATASAAGLGIIGITGCKPKLENVDEVGGASEAGEHQDIPQLPDSITIEEFASSMAEVKPISDFVGEVVTDVVVVGAGAAGVPAAITAAEEGSSVVVLQKQSTVVSQGNCGSGLIRDKSDREGLLHYVQHTNSLNNWRSDRNLLEAYVMNSGEAVNWVYDRARLTGTSADKPNDKGLFAYMNTSKDFTGTWTDNRFCSYDYGKSVAHMYAPWMGPKPNNVGTFLSYMLEEAEEEFGPRMKVYYNTPGVQLIHEDGKVTGVVGKLSDGTYVRFIAKKGVILATGDYMNNRAMVRRWCPDVEFFDKKQFQKTGDGHLMAIQAGAVMENLGHTKMLHDFDAGLMFEEPFLYVNMKGQRFCNEFVGFVYMNDIMTHQPLYKGGKNYDDPETGSMGWYCQVYDADYMKHESVDGVIPPSVMEKYMPEISDEEYEASHGVPRSGCFPYLIDTWRADSLEELAEKLGMEDKEAFLASVERYNELCEKGSDEDFGKDAKWMNPIKKAPFYGIRRHLRVSSLDSGVYTDANGQAVDKDKNPIQGLYCVGNLGGQFYGGADYPFHATGLSLGRCYTFGRLAGKHVAAQSGGSASIQESGITAIDSSASLISSDKWKDGTFEGRAPGVYGKDIVVSVTIANKMIKDIKVVESHETENIGEAALPTYIDAIKANQTTQIDAITGATRTMEGFTEAVNDALAKSAS